MTLSTFENSLQQEMSYNSFTRSLWHRWKGVSYKGPKELQVLT